MKWTARSTSAWPVTASRTPVPMKAPKISPTRSETRDGMTLGEVSPRRYFCLQCHVPQADAKPLVNNTFKPVEALN